MADMLVVLFGAPASGKSTLCRCIQERSNWGSDVELFHIEFDRFENEIRAADLDSSQSENYDFVSWKKARKAALLELGAVLKRISDKKRIVLVDDTLHLRSMRKEIYKIGSQYSTTQLHFIFVDAPLQVCISRNRERQTKLRELRKSSEKQSRASTARAQSDANQTENDGGRREEAGNAKCSLVYEESSASGCSNLTIEAKANSSSSLASAAMSSCFNQLDRSSGCSNSLLTAQVIERHWRHLNQDCNRWRQLNLTSSAAAADPLVLVPANLRHKWERNPNCWCWHLDAGSTMLTEDVANLVVEQLLKLLEDESLLSNNMQPQTKQQHNRLTTITATSSNSSTATLESLINDLDYQSRQHLHSVISQSSLKPSTETILDWNRKRIALIKEFRKLAKQSNNSPVVDMTELQQHALQQFRSYILESV